MSVFLASILPITTLLAVMTMPSCGTGELDPIDAADRLEIKAFAGDSASHGITRAQSKTTIKCDSAEIDDYICLSYEDLEKIFSQLKRLQQKCKAIAE